MKLGKLPARHDARTLHMKQYSQEELPPPPAFRRPVAGLDWPMYANDTYNCCTCAAAAHMVHEWTAARRKEQLLSDAEVLGTYLWLTGGDDGRGVAMLDALRYWRSRGIGTHQIHSYVALDARHPDEIRMAISLFGSAYIGLELPNFALAGDQHTIPAIPWTVPATGATGDAAPNGENGHCVAAVGYDDESLYVVTWGCLKPMGWDFFRAYNEESYGVLSQDWIDQEESCPSGFNFKALQRDLTLLGHESTPASCTP
ncbi:MAG: hypothetical protein ACR2JE_12400 [Acidobacteriaceae bacterium]